MIKLHYTVTLQYEQEIDDETGEILKTTLLKRTVSESKEQKQLDCSGEAKLILSENKYTLNGAAMKVLGVSVGDKVDINYHQNANKTFSPTLVVGDGNKITKSLTVACRGSKNQELAKYGTEFTIESLKEGVFLLKGNIVQEEPVLDENIELPDDLDDIEDITSSFFQF